MVVEHAFTRLRLCWRPWWSRTARPQRARTYRVGMACELCRERRQHRQHQVADIVRDDGCARSFTMSHMLDATAQGKNAWPSLDSVRASVPAEHTCI